MNYPSFSKLKLFKVRVIFNNMPELENWVSKIKYSTCGKFMTGFEITDDVAKAAELCPVELNYLQHGELENITIKPILLEYAFKPSLIEWLNLRSTVQEYLQLSAKEDVNPDLASETLKIIASQIEIAEQKITDPDKVEETLDKFEVNKSAVEVNKPKEKVLH